MKLGPGILALAGGAVAAAILAGAAAGFPAWAQLVAVAAVFAGLVGLSGQRPEEPPTRDTNTIKLPRGLPAGFGRALLHEMPAALIVIAENERLTYANPAAEKLFSNITQGAHFSTVIRAPAFVEAIEEIMESRGDLEFTFVVTGQRDRHFEARASFLPAASGVEFGDTDQIIVQIEDRTRDKAMLQTRSDFVANASHELRTPLASILGYIETLQGHARDDAEARDMFLEIMMSQASRMKRLVDDLMSLSRIEMNAHIRPEEEVDFHALAGEAASALFPLATQNDVLLQIELAQDAAGPLVLGDRDQLSQVIVNLIDNAIKYGGSQQKVRVFAAEPNPKFPGQVGISIADQGPGIAREHIPRITERFFRVNAAKSKDMGGTGLGLAITKHILARHSGALDIQSSLGRGSTFTLWIPRAPGDTQNLTLPEKAAE